MRSIRFPQILPIRQQAALVNGILKKRLETILPKLMRETGFDMWLVLCQEDALDPVFQTLMPLDTWFPILQMLVFHDRGERGGVEHINLSMTNTQGLYDKPWNGRRHEEQWPMLTDIIQARDPRRIGVNIGSVQWAAGGLTYALHARLVESLPAKYIDRLASAEPLVTRWLATLTDEEVEIYEHVANVAHSLLAECYSRKAIVPDVTTIEDLAWRYWQLCADRGLQVSFKPSFYLIRSEETKARYGDEDRVIRAGDLIRSDVGIRYLRLNTDHQEWCYILRRGECDAPKGIRDLMAAGNRLQDIFMAEYREGLSGNELLKNILKRAHGEGVPNPKVYSHSLGMFLHEPGPLIGLPWEQERCEGRGDVRLEPNNCFAMELSVRGAVPEWNGQEATLALEEDVAFTPNGCRLIDGRQTDFYLI